jgi:hypoxanthine phosphoribosyltransferase
MKRAYDIFFSYSHEDKNIASELEAKLTKKGFSCFMSEKIGVADKWQDEIRDAIKSSDYILLLITPRSKDSKWVCLESGAAWILGKKLMPLLQFCTIEDLPEPIKAAQGKVIEIESQRNDLITELIRNRDNNRSLESISFHDILCEIDSLIQKMCEDRWNPGLIIGCGRGGAICAGIIGLHLNKIPIKVVDCQFKWKDRVRIPTIDNSSLNKEDIEGKEILIVECSHRTGQTYELIKQAVNLYKPSAIRSFSLVLHRKAPSKPDYFAYRIDSKPNLPWGRKN